MGLKPGSSLGTFEIVGLLGVGGMGEVYRARDSRLHREVAIKVLPGNVASDAEQLSRFEREARLLASLDHPHIAALYDFQQFEDSCFLVMQLIEGGTLADRLKRGALPLPEALELFSAIAEGLAAAHDRGVVHRDLKPGNIKIDPSGRIKILDFGLAKAIVEKQPGGHSEAPTLPIGTPAEHRTQEGMILGTPAYMSPEQARGQATDKRTDVWAFGVCLYEALCGQRPFAGESATDLLANILREQPDWTKFPAGVPVHLRSILRRCLEKRLERRSSSISDVGFALEDIASELESTPRTAPASPPYSPPSVESTPSPSESVEAPKSPSASDESSGHFRKLAVLPFTSIAKDTSEDWFIDGMTESVITELSKIRSLVVISRASAMQFKASGKPARTIAMELGVDALIEGSVLRAKDKVRIQVRLIDPASDSQRWADDYEGDLDSILDLIKQVSLAVARSVKAQLSPVEVRRLSQSTSVNQEAFECLLRGRQLVYRYDEESLQEACELLERAIELDPGFADAHAFLANAYLSQMWVHVRRTPEFVARMKAASEKALRLDENNALAQIVAGYIAFLIDWNWTEAERRLFRALEINPGIPDVHAALKIYYGSLGRWEEAVKAGEQAILLDPLNPSLLEGLGEAYYEGCQFERAIQIQRDVLEVDPDNLLAYWCLIACLSMLGRNEEATSALGEALGRHPSSPMIRILEANVAHRSGNSHRAHEIVADMLDFHEKGNLPAIYVPLSHIAVGVFDKAFIGLEKAFQERDILLATPHMAFHPLWGDPRFDALLDRMNYPGIRPRPPKERWPFEKRQPGAQTDSRKDTDAPSITKLAVLPFTSIAKDDSEDWLVDGVTEALITELSKIRSISVISRASAMQFKGTTKRPAAIADELGVDALVEGSVQRVGEEISIRARLVDPRGDEQLWADDYGGEMNAILKLQKEAALSIAREIKATVSPGEARRIRAVADVDPKAYEIFLKAIHIHHHLDPESLHKSRVMMEEAITVDPEFADAHACLGLFHIVEIFLTGISSKSLQVAGEAIHRALALDPNNAMAHTVAGYHLLMANWDWSRSEQEFRRGLELNAGLPDTHVGLAWYMNAVGRFDKALRLFDEAIRLDPLNTSWHIWRASALRTMDRDEEALAGLRDALELDPSSYMGKVQRAATWIKLGRCQETLDWIESADNRQGHPRILLPLRAAALAGLDRKAEAEKIANELLEQAQSDQIGPVFLVRIYANLGRSEEALQWLERAFEKGGLWTFELYDSVLKPLWNHPRLNELLDGIKFPGVRLQPEAGASASASSTSSAPDSRLSSDETSGRFHKLAVLPFTSIAKDDSEDWLVDGVTEALITELGKIKSLSVISRSSAMQFKGTAKSAPTIGLELGVDALIEGSVQRVGDELRIQARMIDPRKDQQLWANDYDGEMRGILKLQKEVALSIAREIKATVSPSEARRIIAADEVNPEAYEIYLKAKSLHDNLDPVSLRKSQSLIAEALRLDPGFAPSHAMFAMAHLSYANLYGDLAASAEQIGEAVRKALEIGRDDAMTHHTAGWYALIIERDWNRCEREFRRAIELNPGLPEPHGGMGWFYATLGRYEEAVASLKSGLRLDPLNANIRHSLSMIYQMMGRWEDALKEDREILELAPHDFRGIMGVADSLVGLGRPEEALEWIDSGTGHGVAAYFDLGARACALLQLGRRAEAERLLGEMIENLGNEPARHVAVARICVLLGRLDEAFERLERLFELSTFTTIRIHTSLCKPFWGQPRFEALLDRIGYPGERPKPDPSSSPSSSSSQVTSDSTRSDIASPRFTKLAVLPFTSIAKDASEDWFTDGMTEVLITELGKIKSLTVISRTSAMRFKDTEKPMTEIASELGVDALVEGSVIRMGNDVQITARLIDGKTDERLWGDFFSGKFEDILRLQGKVTLAIAREVKATVSPDDKARVEDASTVQSAAYEEYLRGRVLASEQNSRSFAKAITHLERAVELDPEFMPAHAELACCLSDMMGWRVGSIPDLAPRCLAAAQRARELAPDTARACAAMGMALRHIPGKRSEALSEQLRAVELDGGNAEYRMRLVWELMPAGRLDEARSHAERALELDPLSGLMWITAATVRALARQWDEAEKLYTKVLEVDPDYVPALSYLGLVQVQQGRAAEALPFLRKAVERTEPDVPPTMLRNLGIGLHRSGDTEGARSMLDRLNAQCDSGRGDPTCAAALCLELGLRDQAYEWLQAAVEANDYSAQFIRTEVVFDALREEPRFQALVNNLDFRT